MSKFKLGLELGKLFKYQLSLKILYFLTRHKVSYQQELARIFRITSHAHIGNNINRLIDSGFVKEIENPVHNPNCFALIQLYGRTKYNAPRHKIRFYKISMNFNPIDLSPIFDSILTPEEKKRIDNWKRYPEIILERKEKLKKQRELKKKKVFLRKKIEREQFEKLKSKVEKEVRIKKLDYVQTMALVSYYKKKNPIPAWKDFEEFLKRTQKSKRWDNYLASLKKRR